MAYAKLFFTSGGVQVSAAPATTNPVTFTLRADQNEVGTPVGITAKADSGYTVATGCTITPTGTSAAKWALAPDSGGSAGTFEAYGAALTLSGTMDNATGIPFWVKAKATSDETPANDTTVTLVLAGVASAV